MSAYGVLPDGDMALVLEEVLGLTPLGGFCLLVLGETIPVCCASVFGALAVVPVSDGRPAGVADMLEPDMPVLALLMLVWAKAAGPQRVSKQAAVVKIRDIDYNSSSGGLGLIGWVGLVGAYPPAVLMWCRNRPSTNTVWA